LWPTALRELGAVAAAALAVKLMDDGLDLERDRTAGFPNWAAPLGRGAPAYALLALAAACALSASRAVPLFLAAYAVGMGRSIERQPSGLPGWVEGALALALAWLLFGLVRAAASAAAMIALQWTDGLLDWRADAGYRVPPLAPVPLAALAAAAWTATAALDPLLAATVAACGLAIALLTRQHGG
jgi:hypothetical protein